EQSRSQPAHVSKWDRPERSAFVSVSKDSLAKPIDPDRRRNPRAGNRPALSRSSVRAMERYGGARIEPQHGTASELRRHELLPLEHYGQPESDRSERVAVLAEFVRRSAGAVPELGNPLLNRESRFSKLSGDASRSQS